MDNNSVFNNEYFRAYVGDRGHICLFNGKWLTKTVGEVLHFLHKMSILNSDWSKMLFLTTLPGFLRIMILTLDNLMWANFTKPDMKISDPIIAAPKAQCNTGLSDYICVLQA